MGIKEVLMGEPEITGLRSLFAAELKDVYGAEKALEAALPTMMEKATSEELVTAIDEHLVETKNQITRIEEVFALIGEKPEAKSCKAMDGLIAEATEMMNKIEAGVVRDAAIIASAQKVEHYEIATYGTLITFAETLKQNKAAGILQETLEEEKETDVILTQIAKSFVNAEAKKQEEEAEE
jgi:ferritin-like metal-binding protein YciE